MTKARGVEDRKGVLRRWDSQCMLGEYLHLPICRALLVEEVSRVCLCHGLDDF